MSSLWRAFYLVTKVDLIELKGFPEQILKCPNNAMKSPLMYLLITMQTHFSKAASATHTWISQQRKLMKKCPSNWRWVCEHSNWSTKEFLMVLGLTTGPLQEKISKYTFKHFTWAEQSRGWKSPAPTCGIQGQKKLLNSGVWPSRSP